jgi:hypothetical protein
MRVTKKERIEFEAFGALIAVAVLNTVIFARLAATQSPQANSLLLGTVDSAIMYGIFLVFLLCMIFFKKTYWILSLFYFLFFFITARIVGNLYFLITNPKISDNGVAILTDAFLIWTASLLLFSLWYWIIDRGGPIARGHEDSETRYDLYFPQYSGKIPGWEHWKPKFLDYVFFSFFTSTGFGPADIPPLTKRVKLLMMTEAAISLIIIGMVASRAISLLHA